MAKIECKGNRHQVDAGSAKCVMRGGKCGHYCVCGKRWFKSPSTCKRHRSFGNQREERRERKKKWGGLF